MAFQRTLCPRHESVILSPQQSRVDISPKLLLTGLWCWSSEAPLCLPSVPWPEKLVPLSGTRPPFFLHRWQWNGFCFEFCHCDLSTDWAMAVISCMSPVCVPMVGHNSLYSPRSLHWEQLLVPRTTMLAARPTVSRIVFYVFMVLAFPLLLRQM